MTAESGGEEERGGGKSDEGEGEERDRWRSGWIRDGEDEGQKMEKQSIRKRENDTKKIIRL